MKNANIVPSNYLDVLFLDKNKAYGAYQLRSNYDKVAIRSLLIFFFAASLILGFLYLNSYASGAISSMMPYAVDDNKADEKVVEIPYVDISKPVEVKQFGSTTSAVKTIAFTTPKITPNANVTHSALVEQPIDDNTSISDHTNPDGVEGVNQVQGLPDGVIGGNSTNPNAETVLPLEEVPVNTIYKAVDVKAKAPYDINVFVSKHLVYPAHAVSSEIEGRVMISFVVEVDGSITQVKLMGKDIGGGCSSEAIRVIKKMPNWKPAQVNGKAVRSYFQYPINFTLSRNK